MPGNQVFTLRHWITRTKNKLLSELTACVSLPLIDSLAGPGVGIAALFSHRIRADYTVRAELAREMFGLTTALARRAAAIPLLENLIDRRIYFGRLRRADEAWPELDKVAATLALALDRAKAERPGRPVIVSPFHYVSQYANIYVIDKLREILRIESISVVSGVERNIYGDDNSQIPRVKVLSTYGDENRNGLGMRAARALRRDGVAVIFADAPPFTMHRYPMQTVDVSMFGRKARIHNGVFRLGASHDAHLLAFYLRLRKGRFNAEFFDPIALSDPEAPQQLAGCIETALLDNYPDWLLGGHPSLYAFSPIK